MKVINMDPKKVSFGKNLALAPAELIAALRAIFGDSLLQLCRSIPPMVAAENGSLTLVDRHFAFALLVESNVSKIPGILLSEDERKTFVHANQILEEIIIAHAETLSGKTKNKAGLSRRERKELGYVCPFCRLLIKGPVGHKPETEGKYKGFYHITCYSQNSKKVPCGFQAYLSSEEYILFKGRKYPVDVWLQRTEAPCPRCGKSLFLRTRFSKKFLLCEDNFRIEGACKYRSEQSEGLSK